MGFEGVEVVSPTVAVEAHGLCHAHCRADKDKMRPGNLFSAQGDLDALAKSSSSRRLERFVCMCVCKSSYHVHNESLQRLYPRGPQEISLAQCHLGTDFHILDEVCFGKAKLPINNTFIHGHSSAEPRRKDHSLDRSPWLIASSCFLPEALVLHLERGTMYTSCYWMYSVKVVFEEPIPSRLGWQEC